MDRAGQVVAIVKVADGCCEDDSRDKRHDISDDDLVDDDEDIPVDTNQDYSGDMIDLDIEGADADEIIAAERDIATDPFEDDELIDIAMNTDDGIDVAADDLDDDDDISEI